MALTLTLTDGTTSIDLLGATYHALSIDLGNPDMTRAEAMSLFRDGWDLIAHRFTKRVISIDLLLSTASLLAMSTAVQDLQDALRKARLWAMHDLGSRWRLQWNPGGSAPTISFVVKGGTFSLPPSSLVAPIMLKDTDPKALHAPLMLECDPLAEGAEETVENHIANAGFENAATTLADWTEFINATGTTVRSTAQAKHGSASLLLTMTNSGVANQVVSRHQNVTAAPAEVWSFGVWVYLTALSNSKARMRITWQDAGAGSLGTVDVEQTIVTSGWTLLTIVNQTAPAGTATFNVNVALASTAAAATGTCYCDSVIAVKATTVPTAWVSGRSIANHNDDNGQSHINYVDVYPQAGDYPAKVQVKASEAQAHTKFWLGARHGTRMLNAGIWHEGEDFATWDSEPADAAASGGAYGRWASGLSWKVRSSGTATSAFSLTFAHNPGAGIYKGLLIVGISTEVAGGSAAPTSVTHNGAALTKLADVSVSGTNNVSIWYRVAPDAAGNVVATFAAFQNGIVGGAVTYYGVHQTTPLGTPVTATGNGTVATVSAVLAATVDTVFAAAVSAGTSGGTPGGALDNEHWDVTAGAICQGLGGDAMDVAASNNIEWSALASADWAIMAVAIKPADVAATPKVFTKSVTTPPVGAYRVLARVLGNGGGLGVAMGYAYGGVTEDPSISSRYAAIPTTATVWHVLDIGSVIIPPATLPSGATIGTLTLRLCVYRTSGSTGANFDCDWVMLLPVDYGSAYATKASGTDVVVVDTISRSPTLALWNTSDVFQSRPQQEGTPPECDPDGSRYYLACDDDVDATISDGFNVAVRIVPQYMVL